MKCYSQPRPLHSMDCASVATDCMTTLRHLVFLHRTRFPEAAAGGVIALIEDDDIVDINITERKLDVRVSECKSLQKEKKRWKAQKRTGQVISNAMHTACNLRFFAVLYSKNKDTYYFVGTVPVKRYCVFL